MTPHPAARWASGLEATTVSRAPLTAGATELLPMTRVLRSIIWISLAAPIQRYDHPHDQRHHDQDQQPPHGLLHSWAGAQRRPCPRVSRRLGCVSTAKVGLWRSRGPPARRLWLLTTALGAEPYLTSTPAERPDLPQIGRSVLPRWATWPRGQGAWRRGPSGSALPPRLRPDLQLAQTSSSCPRRWHQR